jgi:23S rRNA (uracil1939-C5)-methyltransferase
MVMIELDIERPVAGGDMLARHDGRVVFVAGALPGERVRAVITRTRGKISWAQVRDVLTPSPDRREVLSDPLCGGRTYAHVLYPRQLALKAEVIADAFRRIAKHPLESPVSVVPSPETEYRLRARLHVDGDMLGFYREGTHIVCAAGPTGQLSRGALTAVDQLQRSLGRGLRICTSILISENAAGDERVATCATRDDASLDPFLGMALPDGLTGVVVQARKGEFVAAGLDQVVDRSATLPGTAAHGRPAVTWVRRGASFFQGNRYLVGALLDRVLATAQGRFIDLYAGVGLFAVSLAGRGQQGLGVEGDPASAGDLSSNAAPYRELLETRTQSVEAVVAAVPAQRPDVVVVDPPRTGLSVDVLSGLITWDAPRLVYVSCDVPTLARDAQRLVAAGYTMTSLEGFDMFPNTPHVECVAVFDRAASTNAANSAADSPVR